jgi:hypothetical protein
MAQPVTLASLAASLAEMQKTQVALLAAFEGLQLAVEADLVRKEAKAPADKPRASRKPAVETTAADVAGAEEKKEKPVKAAAAAKISFPKAFIDAYMNGDAVVTAMVTPDAYKAAEEKTALPKRKQKPEDRKAAVLKTVYGQFSTDTKANLKTHVAALQVSRAKDNSTELVKEKTEVIEDDVDDNADNEGH